MAYAPIAGLIPQYDEQSGWYLKFYLPETTTPIAMSIDAAGTTTLAKAQLDVDGFPTTDGTTLFIPFMDQRYDAYLFPTAAEADANDTINAKRVAENINPLGDLELTRDILTVVSGQTTYALTSDLSSNSAVIVGGEILRQSSYSADGNGDLVLSSPLYDTSLMFEVWNTIVTATAVTSSDIKVFKTVNLMKIDSDLAVGDFVNTYFFTVDVLCSWEIVANATGAGDMSDGTLSLSGSSLQAKLVILPEMTPKHFGAVGNGVTDDAVFIQYCDDNVPSWVVDVPYGSSELILNNNFTCVGNGIFNWVGVNTNPVPAFIKIRSTIFGNVNVDAQTSEIQCIHVDGSVDQVCGDLIYKNITASDITKNVSAGVLVKTTSLTMNTASCTDFVNDYVGGNDSNPQSFVVDAGATVHMNKHVANRGNSGLVNAGGIIHCASNECFDMQDNGLYNLANSITYLDSQTYSALTGEQNEEPLVNQATVFCNTLTVIGKCIACLRPDNAVYTHIGRVIGRAPLGTAQADLWSNLPTGVYQHRSGNVTSGPCYIGSIEGQFTSSIFRTGFSSGTTENLIVDNCNIDLINVDQIDVNPDWVKNNWFNLLGVDEIHLKDITVRMWDILDALTADVGDYFYADYNLSLAIESQIENFDVYIINGDRTPSVNGVFRGKGQQAFLKIMGGVWQTNVGPYMREADFQSGTREACTVLPLVGYWRRGQTFTAADGGVGTAGAHFFRCTATGSPGTWSTLT